MRRLHRNVVSKRRAALLALALLCPIQALAADTGWQSPNLRDHPLVGVLVDARGEPVPESALLSALGSARFAFVGEKHDNVDHHRIEARLIAHRLASVPGSAVVFEMLDDAQRPALPSLSAEDSLEQIRAKLSWPAKGWDFVAYGPLFQASLHGGKAVAGNIGKAFIGRLYQEGDSLLAGDSRFQTVAVASADVRAHLLERIFEAHCGMQARESLAPMLTIQLAKDASMASAVVDGQRALLIAGGEHVRADTGVPSHVRARAPGAGDTVIQLLEVVAGDLDARPYLERAGPADYYWFTPAAEQRDNCAEVKGRAAR